MVIGAFVAMRLRVRRLLLFGVVCCRRRRCCSCSPWASRPHVALLLAAAFLTGVAVEQFGIAWETSMQEHVPADKLARVYSYDMLGSFVAIPIGQVAAGPIAEASASSGRWSARRPDRCSRSSACWPAGTSVTCGTVCHGAAEAARATWKNWPA